MEQKKSSNLNNRRTAKKRTVSETCRTILFFFIFLFLAVLGLRFCARAFSSCGERASHCRGLSRCGAQAPDAQAQQLWLTGPVAPWHVGSSQTRAQTRVPPHWQADSQPLCLQGSPILFF